MFTGKHDRAPNGNAKEMAGKGANGNAEVAARDQSNKDAGAVQLLICVAGIYGSL